MSTTKSPASKKSAAVRKTELVVALDFSDRVQAEHLIDTLSGLDVIYKVGLELFIASGPDLVKRLVRDQRRIFLDLKLFDIPNTVMKACERIAELNVEWTTVHVLGGKDMLRASMTPSESADRASRTRPKILGVTVLTSFSDEGWGEVSGDAFGKTQSVDESVRALALRAEVMQLDGIVCSARELLDLRERFPRLLMVVPGIRPEGEGADDQARVMTPLKAAKAGADAIVVGRPITQSTDPRKTTQQILNDIALL